MRLLYFSRLCDQPRPEVRSPDPAQLSEGACPLHARGDQHALQRKGPERGTGHGEHMTPLWQQPESGWGQEKEEESRRESRRYCSCPSCCDVKETRRPRILMR